MDHIDITIDPEAVLDALDNNDIVMYLTVDEVLQEISASEAVNYYGQGDLLDQMDIATVEDWLKENS
jgi:hypothetical protein